MNLASINLPQVLGYARIAGMPVVTGFYTLLLPLVGFAVFGSSRHLVVAADSATAAIIAGSLSQSATPGSGHYAALAGMVALLTGDIYCWHGFSSWGSWPIFCRERYSSDF